jgi:hypothetical protein
MGFDINIHDQWACESQGRIQDRTREHLGTTDKGIVLYRRLLVDAIRKNQAGEKPPDGARHSGRARDHRACGRCDGIGPSDRWKNTGRISTRIAGEIRLG